MRYLLSVLFWLGLATGLTTSIPALAQQTPDPALMRTDCACPDMDVVLLLDREIASIEQKLIRIGQGLLEDESDLPDNPILLIALRDEARMWREAYLRDITDCQRMCRRYPSADATDPTSAFSGASAACPLCESMDTRLSAAETALANHLNEMENFRRHNRVRDRGGVNTSDFDEAAEAYRAAYAHVQATRTRHAELVAAIEEAEARAGPLGVLQDWEGEDGRVNLFEFMGGMAHSYASAAGGLFDYIIQTGRNDGLPIPDQAYISRMGEIWAAERTARQYYLEQVQPAERELAYASYRVPEMRGYTGADADQYPGSGGSDSVLSRLARYESELRLLVEERDIALDALVACNVRMCRPEPDISDLWGPDGLYTPMSLEERFPDLPPAPADEPDNGEGLLTGDTFEGPDLSGNSDIANGADGMGLPDEIATPGALDIPAAPELPPEVVAALEAAQARGPISSGPCDISPALVCRHLADRDRTDCETQISDLAARCEAFQANAFVTMGRVETCRASCDYAQDSTTVQFRLLDTVLDTLEQRYTGAVEERDRRETQASERLVGVQSEIAALEALREDRRVHLYRNTNSGEILQQAGERFEPQPPLEYVGEMGGQLNADERLRLSELQRERLVVEALLATIPAREVYETWYDEARASWSGGPGFAPMMACSPSDVSQLQAACLASCDAEGESSASVKSICQPAGVVGRLNLPATSTQFIPPLGE